MEKHGELEAKYQKLAAEYSKVRSQATVLKKAVLDEQAKTTLLKETIKLQEQKIRKHDQEMESLTFRNEQLTKRITFLQKELQQSNNNTQNKKTKNKSTENIAPSDTSVVDEELQKKIIENAQLVSSMVDKEFELSDCKERIMWLEKKLDSLEKELQATEVSHQLEMDKMKKESDVVNGRKIDDNELIHVSTNKMLQRQEEINILKEDVEKWRTQCEFLRSQPTTNEDLQNYYESQLRQLLDGKLVANSEARSLWSENAALYQRLENLTVVNVELEKSLQTNSEELTTTIENYKGQLDAMTEHLAAQNDKITKQCDEIQALKHKLSTKK